MVAVVSMVAMVFIFGVITAGLLEVLTGSAGGTRVLVNVSMWFHHHIKSQNYIPQSRSRWQ